MEDDSIDDSVRQRVLLVQERAQEYTIGAIVVHFSNLQDGGGRVKHRDRILGQDTRQDDRLAQRAGATLQGAE